MKLAKSGVIHFNKLMLSGYVLTALLSGAYTFFYDRRFGIAFLAALLVAPLMSYLFTKSSLKEISMDVSFSHSTANKSEIISMSVTVNSGSVFPVPFFCMEFFWGGNLTPLGAGKELVSLSSGDPCVIEQSYTADIWGTALLGIHDIAVSDYLGLFKIKFLPDDVRYLYAKSVEICPAIHEPQTNELLAVIYNEIICDEKEEEQQDVRHSFVSEPGYEHRPYAEGDALKRINWKLSAKTDSYMVREYEPLGNSKPVILLDCCGLQSQLLPPERQKPVLLMEERTVEAVLAMLTSMNRRDIAAAAYCLFGNEWQEFSIETDEDILALQYALARYKFKLPSEMFGISRLPADIFDKSSISMLLFTCALDEQLRRELWEAKSKGSGIDVICPNPRVDDHENIWLVNEFYDFYSLQGGSHE